MRFSNGGLAGIRPGMNAKDCSWALWPPGPAARVGGPGLTLDQAVLAQQLHEAREKTVQQIADLFGVPRGTAYGHLDRESTLPTGRRRPPLESCRQVTCPRGENESLSPWNSDIPDMYQTTDDRRPTTDVRKLDGSRSPRPVRRDLRTCLQAHSRVRHAPLRAPEDAADAVAETFAIAWRRADGCHRAGEARLWLYGVARNVLANHRRGRARHRHRSVELDADVADLYAHSPEGSVELGVIGQRFPDLSEDDRELLALVAWEAGHGQIARTLGSRATPYASGSTAPASGSPRPGRRPESTIRAPSSQRSAL